MKKRTRVFLWSILVIGLLLQVGFWGNRIWGQTTQPATAGMISPSMAGTGSPSGTATCNAVAANIIFIQRDATDGKIWICDNGGGSYAWNHLVNNIKGTFTSGTIAGGSFLLSGCTTATNVTVTGVVPITNYATASPAFVSAFTGNIGLFNVTATVSAANTITVQGCALGVLGSVPNFVAKGLWY